MTSRGLSMAMCALLTACGSSERAPADIQAASAPPAEIEIAMKQSEPRAALPVATVALSTAPLAEELTTGVPECDDYWGRFRACNQIALAQVDAATRASIENTFAEAEQMTKEAWRAIGDPGALQMACRTMLDALAQNPNCPKS